MDIYFHVSDVCNMKCPKCHWFFEKINIKDEISAEDINLFFKRMSKTKIKIGRVFFSGGEPTLWKDLAEAINCIPNAIENVIIFSNGSNPEKLASVNRNICLRISIHNKVKWDKIYECINLAKSKVWKIRFVGYEGAIEKVVFPDWFEYEVVMKREQVTESKKKLHHIIGKKIFCEPQKIYFATDGRAYFCEKGLRSKDDKYVEDFNLLNGLPKIRPMTCIADESCISNIINEQNFKIAEEE
jgi:uncharacterized Fe-S cluster-containing radical SAM superfamily protein